MKNLISLFLLALLWVSACRRDSLITTTTTTDSPIPKEYVKAGLYGTVIDEDNKPISDATVEITTRTGSVTRTTDQNGAFRVVEETLNARGTYVKVTKPGYFHGSKVVNVRRGSNTPAIVMLMRNTVSKSISSTTGGIADYGNFSIELPANSVVYANGTAYTGQIGVAARYLEPSQRNFGLLAPGRLEGYTTDGRVSGLVSLGQMAVELYSSSGDLLQLKPGSEATLRIKLAAPTKSLAKQTIPMWYFDESAGIWKEEGVSGLTGDWYTAKVKHFTFWNWDFTNPSVPIDFKFVDQDGNPVTNVWIDVLASTSHTHGSGAPDDDGHLIGLVPAGEPLVANVYLLFNTGANCGSQPIIKRNIGPFTAPDTVCFVVNSQNTNIDIYSLKGRLLDCNGAPIANGYTRLVNNPFNIYPTDAQGNFTINYTTCLQNLSSLKVYGIDVANLKESSEITVPVSGSGTYTVPDITVCSTISEYFTLTDSLNTVTYPDVLALSDSSSLSSITVLVNGPNNQPDVMLRLNVNNGLTTYTPSFMSVRGQPSSFYACQICSTMTVTVTEFGGIGGYIAGNFSGRLQNPANGNTAPFSGSFRAKIDK